MFFPMSPSVEKEQKDTTSEEACSIRLRNGESDDGSFNLHTNQSEDMCEAAN